jgi:hypothetical protein
MRIAVILSMACAVLVVGGVGCGPRGEPETAQQLTGTCPTCGMAMKEGTYCAKCNAIAATGKPVYCEVCKKTHEPGTYCAKCDRFMTDKTVTCACGREAPLGGYCERCDLYTGTYAVSRCKKCEKPFATAEGCPTCTQ